MQSTSLKRRCNVARFAYGRSSNVAALASQKKLWQAWSSFFCGGEPNLHPLDQTGKQRCALVRLFERW